MRPSHYVRTYARTHARTYIHTRTRGAPASYRRIFFVAVVSMTSLLGFAALLVLLVEPPPVVVVVFRFWR